MLTKNITGKTEEFVEAVYRLEEKRGVARTSELVRMLNVVPGTITNTVERLEKKGILIHKAYKGVKLTEKGQQLALRVLRRHRLSERLLFDHLHMEWSEVHEAACNLEHGITEEIAKKIEKTLNWPKKCPHGNPIPTNCGGILSEKTAHLSKLKPGEKGVVERIVNENHKMLEKIEKLGLKPGVHVTIVPTNSHKGFIEIKTDEKKHILSLQVASAIRVKRLGDSLQVNSEVTK
jgi:DtxR family Mn-dependent transcriptional regulator